MTKSWPRCTPTGVGVDEWPRPSLASPGRRQIPICEYCATWGQDRHKLTAIIDEATARAKAIHPDCWNDWEICAKQQE
eukprot:6889413-Lingulodinium_polyedra.AAC.1